VKTKWLCREVLPSPFYCLCLSEKEFKKALSDINIKEKVKFIKNNQSSATVHYYENNSKLCCIVCMHDFEDAEFSEIIGLLIHESVHIVQEFADFIGESHWGRETQAYLIQTISQRLIESYQNKTK
jgi:hypothetical protein